MGSNGWPSPASTSSVSRAGGSFTTSCSCHQIAKNFVPVRSPASRTSSPRDGAALGARDELLPAVHGGACQPVWTTWKASASRPSGSPNRCAVCAHPAADELLQLPSGLWLDLGDVRLAARRTCGRRRR